MRYQNKSLEVVPNQNDFDSGPRKSRKIDLPRRVKAKKHRNNARVAVNINVSVVESMLLGNSGRRIFCGCLLIRLVASCRPKLRGSQKCWWRIRGFLHNKTTSPQSFLNRSVTIGACLYPIQTKTKYPYCFWVSKPANVSHSALRPSRNMVSRTQKQW